MKINLKIVECAYLVLLVSLLLYVGPANLMDHKISHDFPYSLSAADAFNAVIYSDYILKSGSFRYYAPYISLGYNDSLACNPPMTYIVPAAFSSFSRFPVHDSVVFFVFVTSIMSALLMYLIIRRHSVCLAILSSPFFLFLFFKTSIIGFSWGIWTALIGSFSMLVTLFALQNIDLPKSEFLITVGLVGTIMANFAYFMFVVLFVVAYYFLYFLRFKSLRRDLLKKIVLPVLVALLLCSYYLIVFNYARLGTESKSLQLFTRIDPVTDLGSRWIVFTELDWYLYVIIAGTIISLAFLAFKTDKTSFFVILVALFLILIMLGNNYMGLGYRSLKARYHFAIYLAFFFGIVLYQVLYFLKLHKNRLVCAGVALGFCGLLIGTYYSQQGYSGMMNPYYWEAFNWIRGNTPEDSVVYLFFGDYFDQGGFIYNDHRNNVVVEVTDYVNHLRNNTITSTYNSKLRFEGACYLTYRTGFLKFQQHEIPESLKQPIDFCRFGYYLFLINPQFSSMPPLIQYNNLIRSKLLQKSYIKEEFNNGVVSILHNTNPGGDCIGG
jgi:hypothetical protein